MIIYIPLSAIPQCEYFWQQGSVYGVDLKINYSVCVRCNEGTCHSVQWWGLLM